jgi:hypothetical protein
MILALMTDIIVAYYPLWDYTASNIFFKFFRIFSHSFGIYFVTVYLFIQTLPSKLTAFRILLHIFLWTILALTIEFLALETKSIIYGFWWKLRYSYIMDWILYLIFYFHHSLLNKYTQVMRNDL